MLNINPVIAEYLSIDLIVEHHRRQSTGHIVEQFTIGLGFSKFWRHRKVTGTQEERGTIITYTSGERKGSVSDYYPLFY